MAPVESLIVYVQVRFWHVHVDRVLALNRTGPKAVGLELAGHDAWRPGESASGASPTVERAQEGSYSGVMAKMRSLAGAVRIVAKKHPEATLILDDLSDPVQLSLGVWARIRGRRVFVRWASTREDYDRRAWKEWLKARVYRGWSGYLATGARARAYLLGLGVCDENIVACGNPVNSLPLARPRHLEAPSANRFLFVGRFIWHKNLVAFIDAFARYRATGGSWDLAIAGDGLLAAEVRERAEGGPGVALLGHLEGEHLIAAYHSAACLVLPSISENWGLVVNEAMHASLPVIVSERCGCVPELVRDGVNGFLIDPSSIASMADALHRMEATSETERATMGAASRSLAEAQSMDEWAQRVVGALGLSERASAMASGD